MFGADHESFGFRQQIVLMSLEVFYNITLSCRKITIQHHKLKINLFQTNMFHFSLHCKEWRDLKENRDKIKA